MQPEQLERLLKAAGDRARSASDWTSDARPDRAFAADLRDRLLTQLPHGAHNPRVGWSLPQLFRMPRLLPLAIAATLLLAGVVAARELYVAIGDHPTPTPAPSVSPEPTPEPTPSATPRATPLARSVLTPVPTAVPTPVPTPVPTAVPTPKPTPVPPPALSSLALTATGCNGGVVLDWSKYDGAAPFNHYSTLRNTSNSIPKAYPPQDGAVDPGGTYTTQLETTAAVDVELSAGTTYYYRAMAFNAANEVIAASAIASAVPQPVAPLGPLGVGPVAEGTQLSWTPYAGPGACFTWYKLVYSEDNPFPAYLGGDAYLAAISSQETGSYVAAVDGLVPGHAYYLRVQVIRGTDLGAFLVAETDVATYTVP